MGIPNERPTVTPYILESDLVTWRRCGAKGEMNKLTMRGLEKAQHWRLSRCHLREDRETHSYCLTSHWLSTFIPRTPCSFQHTVCCRDAQELWFCSACTCSCHRCAEVDRQTLRVMQRVSPNASTMSFSTGVHAISRRARDTGGICNFFVDECARGQL